MVLVSQQAMGTDATEETARETSGGGAQVPEETELLYL